MSNFESPAKLNLAQPSLAKMDAYRKHPRRDSKVDIYFVYERDSQGRVKRFRNEQGEQAYLVQLWWVMGNRSLVQRNYPITEQQMTERGWKQGGYHGK